LRKDDKMTKFWFNTNYCWWTIEHIA